MNHWLHLIKRNLYISSSGNIWVACTSSPPPPLHSHKASSLTHEWLFPLHRTVTFTTRGEDWECRQQTPQKKRNGPPSCQCMILPSEQGWSEGETFSTQFLSSNVCVCQSSLTSKWWHPCSYQQAQAQAQGGPHVRRSRWCTVYVIGLNRNCIIAYYAFFHGGQPGDLVPSSMQNKYQIASISWSIR